MQINIIKNFLKNRDWQFTELGGKNVLLFAISGKNGNFQCVFDLVESENLFVFFSVCSINTPSEKRDAMLELLNTLNHKLFFGNFQMGTEDGEIRFKTAILYQNLEVNEKFIEEIIMRNIVTMDRCLPAIMNLIYGNIGTEEAILQASEA